MASLHRLIEASQDLKALRGYADHDRSAVFGLAAACDQLALFEPVEQASDIWISSNHSAGDLSTGQSVGRAPQNAEHVVLGWGQSFALENADHPTGQHVGSTHELQKRRLLGTTNASTAVIWLGCLHRALNILVITT